MYNEFLRDKIKLKLPIKLDKMAITKSNVNELMQIYSQTLNERQIVTCRPVAMRSSEEQKLFYENLLKNNSLFLFTVINTITNEIIGKISVSDYNPRNQSVELGYHTLPKFRKNGYTKSAIKAILKLLFDFADINKVYAQTACFNMESIRLLTSLGFSKDAVLREHHELDGILFDDYIYSILKSENTL